MKRLLDADIRELRNEFLFEFAERFHWDGNQVDALFVYDFFNYVRGVKQRMAEEKKRRDEEARNARNG